MEKTKAIQNAEDTAQEWVSEEFRLAVITSEIEDLKQDVKTVELGLQPFKAARAELIAIRENIGNLKETAILNLDCDLPDISALEATAIAVEQQLEKLRPSALKTNKTVKKLQAEINAKSSVAATIAANLHDLRKKWLDLEHAGCVKRLNAAFDSIEPILAEMSALEKLLPPPPTYTMLKISVLSPSQAYFEQLKRLRQQYPKPSMPFTTKWLTERETSDLPSAAVKTAQLAARMSSMWKGSEPNEP